MNSAVTIACPKSCSPATPAERRLGGGGGGGEVLESTSC